MLLFYQLFEMYILLQLDETRSRIKSFSDTSDSNLLKSDDFITLKVYGIAEAGEIKLSLRLIISSLWKKISFCAIYR